MLLFIDESGHDHQDMPCEALAGVAISEGSLWNLVRAIRAAEREYFGDYFRNLRDEEPKAKRLLKRKRFRVAQRELQIPADEMHALAHAALIKGKAAREQRRTSSGATERELVDIVL